MRIRLATLSLSHFMVDFGCAFFLYRALYLHDDWYLILLLYNFCAFALQMPFGILIDRTSRAHIYAAAGCLLVAASMFLGSLGVAAAVLIGIGNALFHVGGGVVVLKVEGMKAGPLGIFISPGAIGLYAGALLGKSDSITFALSAILLFLCGVLCLFCKSEENVAVANSRSLGFPIVAVICLFLVVVLRSYMGFMSSFEWKAIAPWGLISVVAVAAGKAAGGILGDKVGLIRASLISLGIATLCFFFAQNALLGTVALFLFNMTMPITLFALSTLLPKREGFSFGLLTFALFLGFLPTYMLGHVPEQSMLFFPAVTLISLLLLGLALLIRKGSRP